MLQARTRWSVQAADQSKVDELINELQLAPLVATLLINRGIDTPAKASEFLFPTVDFYDPFILKDMDRCVNRINEAIEKNERIVVYGDYDADGVSSTVVLLKALQELGATSVNFYIPNRFTEGYGPNEKAFRHLKNEGYDLIITVDNGISAIHEAQVAKEIGIDLIVTDHHEPGPVLPEAIAVIHPNRKDSTYPFKELAGVGVAFKVATALLGKPPEHLLPYAAIGTIADLVSLHDENRLIAKKGLSHLRKTNEIGLLALMKLVGIKQTEINEETIGFTLAPRINAPGRLDSASTVVELFMTENRELAEQLADEINEINTERQEIVNEMTNKAMEMVAASQAENNHSVIIVGNEGWHPGVIGIVASRLVEKFYRPVFVFSYDRDKGLAKGSARSIPGFNLYENLYDCKDLLPHFGGHKMAAGLTLNLDEVEELHSRLNQLANEQLTEEDFIPVTELDGIFTLEETTLEAIEQMQLLAPFGMHNPKPKVLIKDVQLPQLKKVGGDQKHLKVTLSDGVHQLDGIAFDMGSYADHLSPVANASIIGELGINEWNNTRKPQIFLKDISVSEWQLFDYRGNKKLQQWINKLPNENCKFIIFQEDSYDKFPEVDELIFIDSDETAKNCHLDGMHVVILDMPPNRHRIECLLTDKSIARIYAHFYQHDTQFFRTIPTRDHFKWFFAFLLKKGVFDINRYGNDLANYRGWSKNTIHFMTKVFFELDFVTINNGIISVVEKAKKRDLTESKTYQERIEMIQLEKELLYSSYDQLKKWLSHCMQKENHEEAKVLWT
ncbi:single-stranded-DNA-specific exonuclease RecJ [Caldibacillus lycopersici]|uniref:Single-stranded-DNA-specific exonuclease RecJ n=1 Tax=Perspicuibacillus lycopersici TaxID=1325689 RepID=A0AAE3ISW2_9BACI|nr:single-stranded-DNA-specific exonuclease RecJ [Perspicuibacillus lycopersici]MCU9613985.1 single-stranded-DNA-specific exonuclease RecJ [Perspicuibacillus lycopersici]